MFTLESFRKQYETDTIDVTIKDRSFTFFVPSSLNSFVDFQDVFHDFPLWAKVWEGSLVLADFMAGRPVEKGKRYIEIGAGLGVVGIAASAFGHNVTMTEYNRHALDFARANALLNQRPDMEINYLDWRNPTRDAPFDYIIGSEVAYHERSYPVLFNLFKTCLKPDGEIILCEGLRKTSMNFFNEMQDHFEIRARKKTLRRETEEFPLILAQMKFKDPVPAG